MEIFEEGYSDVSFVLKICFTFKVLIASYSMTSISILGILCVLGGCLHFIKIGVLKMEHFSFTYMFYSGSGGISVKNFSIRWMFHSTIAVIPFPVLRRSNDSSRPNSAANWHFFRDGLVISFRLARIESFIYYHNYGNDIVFSCKSGIS